MAEKKTQKQQMEDLVKLLGKWQTLEQDGIKGLTRLQAETDNRFLREVLDIIKHDSAQHHRVQQLLIDSLTKEACHLTPEEVAAAWEKLEEHDRLEEKTIRMAHEARRNTGHPIVRYFLNYLLADEEKHHQMLENLEDIKRNLYPYGW